MGDVGNEILSAGQRAHEHCLNRLLKGSAGANVDIDRRALTR